VVFMFGGNKKQRGRAYIEIDDGLKIDRLNADIGSGEWHAHDVSSLVPGQQYNILVFMQLDKPQKLWVDRDHVYAPVLAGCYVTDSAFLSGLHRAQLEMRHYELRVIIALGDVEHSQEHSSSWRTFAVP